MGRSGVLLAAVMASAVVATGCSTPAKTSSPSPPPPVYRSARIPPEVAAPRWPYREYRRKGAWRAKGLQGSTVLLVHDVIEKTRNRNELHLLDLRTGRSVEARHEPVDPGLIILGYALGDGWVAWEEVGEGDLDRDPRTVVWKLFAAPFDPLTLRAGKARLVDTGVLAARSRPLFGFIGSTMYVGTTLRASSDSDGRVGRAAVDEIDLAAGGRRRELVRGRTPLVNIAVSEGFLVVTTRRRAGSDDDASRIEVLDRAGRRTWVFDPPRTGIVRHSPAVHGGNVVWAEIMPGEGATTNIYLRSPDGTITALTHAGNDGAIAGEWAFAEASEKTTESVRTKSFAPGAQVFGMRLDGGGRFRLVDGLIQRGYWWQIANPAEYHSDRLILWRDGTAFDGDGTSVIRVYELPPVRAATSGRGG